MSQGGRTRSLALPNGAPYLQLLHASQRQNPLEENTLCLPRQQEVDGWGLKRVERDGGSVCTAAGKQEWGVAKEGQHIGSVVLLC